MSALHCEEDVMKSSEVEVYLQGRQEGGCQPLPDQVPREEGQFQLDAR